MSLELALAMLRLVPSLVLWDFKTDRWPPVPISKAQNVVGAGFSHAAAGSLSGAAGALAGFMGFQNWRMAPGPDLKGSPRPKMSLELALAMLRLVPSLVLWDFKTDGWPPVPISKALPGPKCAAAGALGFQNWRMPPCPDLKGCSSPKCRWSWL